MSNLPIHDQAVAAWCARVVADAFAPLWAIVAGNPLCLDAEHRCATCGSRLNTATTERFRGCPLGCEEVAS